MSAKGSKESYDVPKPIVYLFQLLMKDYQDQIIYESIRLKNHRRILRQMESAYSKIFVNLRISQIGKFPLGGKNK